MLYIFYFVSVYFRILAFYRVPPTIGRELNLTNDVKRLADPNIRKTFFISPGM